MREKKSFILKVPNFLATPAAPIFPRVVFASCYFALILGFLLPINGTFAAVLYCLTVWQIFKLKSKKQRYYKIYINFLMQRIALNILFVGTVFYFSFSLDYGFNVHYWYLIFVTLGTLHISDIILALKGFIGVGFINANKHNK